MRLCRQDRDSRTFRSGTLEQLRASVDSFTALDATGEPSPKLTTDDLLKSPVNRIFDSCRAQQLLNLGKDLLIKLDRCATQA